MDTHTKRVIGGRVSEKEIQEFLPDEYEEDKPVSRAEEKLAGVAEAFSYSFKDKVVLDIGSSTGGFTEYALKHGAKKVIAIEKGTNQMKEPLRFDPRVELHEKTDIFDVKIGDHVGNSKIEVKIQAPDVILADVSFISLTKVLAYAKIQLTRKNTDFFVMLKPQFEARPDQLIKGVVKNEKMRREIIKGFEAWLRARGFVIKNKRDSAVPGRNGNIERFYLLSLSR